MPAIHDPSMRRSATPPQRPPPPACVPRRNHSESPSHDRPSSASSQRSTDSAGSHRSVRFEDVFAPRHRQQQQQQRERERRRRSGSDIRQVSSMQMRGRRQRPEITIISAQPMINHPAFADGDKGGYIPPEAPPSYEQAMRTPLPLNPTFTDPTVPDHISEVRRVFPEVQTINESRSSAGAASVHPVAPAYEAFVTSQTIQQTSTVTSTPSSRTRSVPQNDTRNSPSTSGTSVTPASRSRNINHSNSCTPRTESSNVVSSERGRSPHSVRLRETSQPQVFTGASAPEPSSSRSQGRQTTTTALGLATASQKPSLPLKKPALRPKPRTLGQTHPHTERTCIETQCGSPGAQNCNNNSSKQKNTDVTSSSSSGNSSVATSHRKLDEKRTTTVTSHAQKQISRSQSQPDILRHTNVRTNVTQSHHTNMSSAKPPIPASRPNKDVMSMFEGGASNGLPPPIVPGAHGGAPPGGLMSPLIPSTSVPQGGSLDQSQGDLLTLPTLAPALVPEQAAGGGAVPVSSPAIGGLPPPMLQSASPQGGSMEQIGVLTPTIAKPQQPPPKKSPQHTATQNGMGNQPNSPHTPLSPNLAPQARKLPAPPRPSNGPKRKKSETQPAATTAPAMTLVGGLMESDFNDNGYASVNYQQRPKESGILSPTKLQIGPPVPLGNTSNPPLGGSSAMSLLDGGDANRQVAGTLLTPLSPNKSEKSPSNAPPGGSVMSPVKKSAATPVSSPAHQSLSDISTPLLPSNILQPTSHGIPAAQKPLGGAPGQHSTPTVNLGGDSLGSSPAHPTLGDISGPHSPAGGSSSNSPAHPTPGGILTPTKLNSPQRSTLPEVTISAEPGGTTGHPMDLMSSDVPVSGGPSIMIPQSDGPNPVPRKAKMDRLNTQGTGQAKPDEPVYAAVARKRSGKSTESNGNMPMTAANMPKPGIQASSASGTMSLDVIEPSRDQILAAELEAAAPALPSTRPPLEDFEDLLSPAEMDKAMEERSKSGGPCRASQPSQGTDVLDFDPLAPQATPGENTNPLTQSTPGKAQSGGPTTPKHEAGFINPVYESGNFINADDKLPHVAHSSLSPAIPPPRNKKKTPDTSSITSSDSSGTQDGTKSAPPLPKSRPTGSEGSVVVFNASEKKEPTSPEATLVLRSKKDEKEESSSFTKKLKRKSVKIKKSLLSVAPKKSNTAQKSTAGKTDDQPEGKQTELLVEPQLLQPQKKAPPPKPVAKPQRPTGPPARPTNLPTTSPARPTALPTRASPSPSRQNKAPSPTVASRPLQPQSAPPKPTNSPKVRPAKPPPPKLVPSRAAPARPEPRRSNTNMNNHILIRLQTESPEHSRTSETPPTAPKSSAADPSLRIQPPMLLGDAGPTFHPAVQPPTHPMPKPRSSSKPDPNLEPAAKPRPGPPGRPAPGRPQMKPARAPPASPGPKKPSASPSGQAEKVSQEPRHPVNITPGQKQKNTAPPGAAQNPPVPRARTNSNPQPHKPQLTPEQPTEKVPTHPATKTPLLATHRHSAKSPQSHPTESVPTTKMVPKAAKTTLENRPPGPVVRVVAVFDFSGAADDELSFKAGTEFVVTSRINDEWLQGKINGKTGIFPKEFVKVTQPALPPQESLIAGSEGDITPTNSSPPMQPSGVKPSSAVGGASSVQGASTTITTFQPYSTWDDNPAHVLDGPLGAKHSTDLPTSNQPHPALSEAPLSVAGLKNENSSEIADLGRVDNVEKGDIPSSAGGHKLPQQEADFITDTTVKQEPSLPPTGGGSQPLEGAQPQAGAKTLQRRTSTALFDFVGQDGSELTFKQGDVISVTGKVNEEWLTGEIEGQTGMFPAAFIADAASLEAATATSDSSGLTNVTHESLVEEPFTSGSSSASSGGKFVEPMATAKSDYVAQKADEISFKVNDTLYLLETVDATWFTAQHDVTGDVGKIPLSHVTVIHPLPEGGNKMDWTL